MKKYETKQKHINKNLSNISSSLFSILINALFISTTFANKSIFTKNETQSATKSIKKKRDRFNTKNNTKSITKSIKKELDRFKKN